MCKEISKLIWTSFEKTVYQKIIIIYQICIFSSEVDEKRQLLNFVFQNLSLEGKKLVHTLREPFLMIMNMKECQMDGGSWTRTNGDRSRGIYSLVSIK